MVNYAMSALASVSASDSLTYGSFHLNQLIDGKILASAETGLGYTSASTDDSPMDITVSLGALRNISEVWLYPRQDILSKAGGVANFPKIFNVECSSDGVNFTVLKHVENATVEGSVNAFPPYKVVLDAPVKTEYVRISVLKRGVSASDESATRVQLTEIEIYGGGGGREDHFLGVLQLLLLAKKHGFGLTIYTNYSKITMQSCSFSAKTEPGTTISLVPFSGDVHILSSEGLYYPLKNLTLSQGNTRGISNVATGDVFSLAYEKGDLLVFQILRQAE